MLARWFMGYNLYILDLIERQLKRSSLPRRDNWQRWTRSFHAMEITRISLSVRTFIFASRCSCPKRRFLRKSNILKLKDRAGNYRMVKASFSGIEITAQHRTGSTDRRKGKSYTSFQTPRFFEESQFCPRRTDPASRLHLPRDRLFSWW